MRTERVNSRTVSCERASFDKFRLALGDLHANGCTTYEELAESIPLSVFRTHGLMGQLLGEFDGDISLALRSAYPELFKKPVLSLDNIDRNDPTQFAWKELEEEIARKIATTMDGKPRLTHTLFWNRTKNSWVKRSNNRQERARLLYENWWDKENRDLVRVVNGLVKPGDAVCSFLSGYDAVLPSLLTQSVGRNGQVIVLTPEGRLDERLFAAFERLFVNWRALKGLTERDETTSEWNMEVLKRKISGYERVRSGLKRNMREFLHKAYLAPSLMGQAYNSGMSLEDLGVGGLFFKKFGIYPVRYPSHNLGQFDAIVECGRFTQVPPEAKQSVLEDLDSKLKPGGFLIFRESAREQTYVEYYGKEIWDRKYRRIALPGIGSAQIAVYYKRIPGEVFVSPWQVEKRVAISTKRRKIRLERFKREVKIASLESEEIGLTWFRKHKFWDVLMEEFDGDVEQALGSVRIDPEPVVVKEEAVEIARRKEQRTYTVGEIAKLLGVEAGEVNDVLGSMGIKRSRAPKSMQGRKKETHSRFSSLEYEVISAAVRARKGRG